MVYFNPAPIFFGFFVFFLTGLFWFHTYTGLRRGQAYLALAASALAGGLRSFYRMRTTPNFYNSNNQLDVFLSVAATGLLIVFVTAFALRLWGRWIGDRATPAERLPGVGGIRAWFCASNVVVGSALILCAWWGDDISPLLGVVLVGALLAAAPVARSGSPANTTAAPVPEDLSPEREKIVAMLEAGKLTPEESAELLQALGGSSRSPAKTVPLTGGQRLMLIGAALVAVGFFLPWFVINPGKEASRMMEQLQSSMPSTFHNTLPMPSGMPFGEGQMNIGSVTVSGGDIQRGLGWAALILALASALLPYVATALDATTARTIRLLCLGLGALIVLYLLTQNLRFVGIGLVIAVAGYALEITGLLRERQAVPA
jgi:hypothetical protein